MATTVDDSFNSVPRLDDTGKNFMIFQLRFRLAMEDKELWGHFDGTDPRPSSTADPADISAWEKHEAKARNRLAQKLTDSALTKLLHLSTANTMWASILNEYTIKSAHVISSMRSKFDTMKCADNGNVRTHFDTLRTRFEELNAVGVLITKEQYATRVIESLPEQYQAHLSTIQSAARGAAVAAAALAAATSVASAAATSATAAAGAVPLPSSPTSSTFAPIQIPQSTILPADMLMQFAIEEYDRLQTSRTRRGAKEDTGVALSVQSNSGSGKPKWKGGASSNGDKSSAGEPRLAKNGKPYGVCWNCGGKGHVKDKCPSPAIDGDGKKDKEKSSKGKDKGGDSANAVTASEDDGVWSVITSNEDLLDDDISVISPVSSVESFSDTSVSWEHVPGYLSDKSAASAARSHSESTMPSLRTASNSSVSNETSMPDLLSVSDSSSEDGGDQDRLTEVSSSASSNDSYSQCGNSDANESDMVAAVFTEITEGRRRIELYDSGTTQHISPFRDQFTTYEEIPRRSLQAANQQEFFAVGSGDMVIDVPDGVDAAKLRLTEVLYSPEVGYTLISVGRLDEAGYSATFGQGECEIRDPDGARVGSVPKNSKGLYRVVHESVDPSAGDSVNAATTHLTPMAFHRRMGHIAPAVAKRLVKDGFVTGISLDTSSGEPTFCESCTYAKSRRQAIPKTRQGERATAFGQEIHSDVWGKAPVESIGGRQYYVSFTDDYSRLTSVYLLRKKSETFDAYKKYEAWLETQHDAKIRALHTDRGGEYLSGAFIKHLESKGIAQKLTVHDTPEENGVAESVNRVALQRVRALLHGSGLPKNLWGEALRHVIWLKNRTSTTSVEGMTPFEAATGKKPDLSALPEWGCAVWVHTKENSKLDARAVEGRWVGFDDQSNGSRIYWPGKNRVSVERSLTFTEPLVSVELEGEHDVSDSGGKPAPQTSSPTIPSEPPCVPTPPPVTPPQPPTIPVVPDAPRAQRTRKPSQYVRDLQTQDTASGWAKRAAVPRGLQAPTEEKPADVQKPIEEESDDWELTMVVDAGDIEPLEPKALAEAKRRPDWPEWERAIHEELKTLEESRTWDVVDAPSGVNVVGAKWVFRIKRDAAGRIVRYKARLVAQGFSQVEGVDYFDTYAPVAKLASIRTILALAARFDLELHQIDIKGAYLNGELTDEEVIYMRQPPGFPYPDSVGKVLRLLKTIYGLKQSGRRWYQRLWAILQSLGFSRCDVDQAVFYRRDENSIIVIAVHVDDCTIAASELELVVRLKRDMSKHVEVTDLGELHWLLGIEVKRDRSSHAIRLSQKSYIDDIVRRFNFDELRPISTPMDPNLVLSSSQSPSTPDQIAAMRNIPFREAIGSLMYASLATRPDITFAVARLSQYLQNPGPAHWDAAKRVFRYLKGTREFWLGYGEREEELTGWVDADGSQEENRRAISGYAYLIDGGAVSWNSKQQELVVLSTTEGEYVAATHAAKEGLWLRSFIAEVFGDDLSPTTLFSDNKSAIALSKDHQYHARTKHIDIRYHFIRYIIENGSMRLIYCPTEDMVADTLTKPLPSVKAKHFAAELGLRAA